MSIVFGGWRSAIDALLEMNFSGLSRRPAAAPG